MNLRILASTPGSLRIDPKPPNPSVVTIGSTISHYDIADHRTTHIIGHNMVKILALYDNERASPAAYWTASIWWARRD